MYTSVKKKFICTPHLEILNATAHLYNCPKSKFSQVSTLDYKNAQVPHTFTSSYCHYAPTFWNSCPSTYKNHPLSNFFDEASLDSALQASPPSTFY